MIEIWSKSLENLSIGEKVELLHTILLDIFRNFIPNKKKTKCDSRKPPWMTGNIRKSLKERCKLTIFFYQNGQRKTDHDNVLEKSVAEVLEAENNYILKMTKKLADSNTVPKTYWNI